MLIYRVFQATISIEGYFLSNNFLKIYIKRKIVQSFGLTYFQQLTILVTKLTWMIVGNPLHPKIANKEYNMKTIQRYIILKGF